MRADIYTANPPTIGRPAPSPRFNCKWFARLSKQLREKVPIWALASATWALGACATFTPGLGFEDVHRIIAERTSKDLFWEREGTRNPETQTRIRALLSDGVSVDSAVQIAVLQNPLLQATYQELGIAQADLVELGLPKNPLVAAEAQFGAGGTKLEFSVVQSVLNIFHRSTLLRLGAADFEASKLRVVLSVLDLIGDVKTAFYTLQAAEQLYAVGQTTLTSNEASYELTRKLFEAGNTTDLDLANAQVLYEQSKLAHSAARLKVVETGKRLAALLGVSGEQALNRQIEDRLPEIPTTELSLDELEQIALEKSIELEQLRNEITAAGLRNRLALSYGVLGDVEAGLSSQKEEGAWSTGPAISLPIPIFSQGQAASGRAEAELRKLYQTFVAVTLSIRSEASIVRARLQNAREQVTRYMKVVLPLRHRITQETQEHYNAMFVSAFQLLQAKQFEIMEGVRYVEELRSYWIARSDAEQLLSGGRVRSGSSAFPTLEPLTASYSQPGATNE